MPQRPTHTTVLRISDEQTLQLIRECKNEQCLWNTNLPHYPNKEERMVAYEAIAQRLDIPCFRGRHVMVKFKNLRNSYCQELKKMGANDKYRPKVFWFTIMDEFLRPHLQKIRSYSEKTKLLLGRKQNRHNANTEPDTEEHAGVTDWAIGHSTPSDASCSNSMNNESTFLEESKIDIEESTTSFTVRKRKLSLDLPENEKVDIKQSYSDIEEDSIQSPKSDDPLTGVTTTLLEIDGVSTTEAKGALPSAVCQKDHYEVFGNYIASLLRSLPPKKALMLQPRIVNLVVSVGLEELNDNDS